MTLLERTYQQLHNTGLAPNAQAFSVEYLGKNRNWYAYQKCRQRDFSIDAAVQCLRRLRIINLDRSFKTSEIRQLKLLEQDLLEYLQSKHFIRDVR